MSSLDFARLRNQTMADGQDSEVTVNTRALIDKVLARYSSEHTTLRELIQNASDAGATTVTIKLETDPSLNIPTPQSVEQNVLLKHVIQHHTVKRLIVSNNGQPFTSADWSRLKSIADGNPDESKIGAFGVGFYSVFADCDEPFVVSGDKTMAFYWKGNTLSTKVSNVPAVHHSSNTTFSLEYRQANPASPSYNPSKIPNLQDLCQFLATSLTFVGLSCIELHLDEYKVASFSKVISPPDDVQVPKGLKTETEGGLLRVARVTRQHSQINAEWCNIIATAQNPPKRAAEFVQAEVRNAGSTLKSFFSKFSGSASQTPTKANKPPPPAEKKFTDEEVVSGDSKGIIFLQVCTIEAETRVKRSFAAEIERATKKPPPKRTKIALLTSPYHDASASLSTGSGATMELASKIFSEVLPTKSGRIFIGFPTAQTTGYLAHISAPSLIPTVERENVDMNARYISTWNIELLRLAGLACRISYISDMAEIQASIGRNASIDSMVPKAVYTFQQYTENASYPSTSVGEKIEEAFWSCSTERSIEMLSTKGVMASKFVRMPAETLSFLGEVPMVPQDLATGAVTFMLSLHNRAFISELTMADIRKGLESRALSSDELLEFLKWCGAKLDSREIDGAGVRSLFDITVANVDVNPEVSSGRIIALGDISTYVNASKIMPTLPVPSDTIPFEFSKSIPVKQLQMFGWIELSVVRWLRHMTTAPQLQEFTTSEKLATQVVSLTAKSWDQIDAGSKEAVVNILTPHPIMPTKAGLRKPEESYFPTVKLFDDLPTVKQFPGSKEKFLVALGVRKTVDLPMVFDRMRNDTAQQSEKTPWNHVDLIRYFASVTEEIPKKDLDRLRQTSFLPGEGSDVKQGQLFKASDLYAPDQAILSLGLTQVKLPFEFKANLREGVFLLRLGLRQWPDSITIAGILHRAGQARDKQLYSLGMEYFLQNYYKNGYGAEMGQFSSLSLPILPTAQVPFPSLVAPFQCFTNRGAACLDYAILRHDLQHHADKLGVQRDPPIQDAVQRVLKSPPKTKLDAESQFSYLASRSTELDQNQALLSKISSTNIVPVFRKYYLNPNCSGFEDRTKRQTGDNEPRIHHYDAPQDVFVGRDHEWQGILDYVQYSSEATAFLLKAGAKHEPSTHDLAGLLSKSPSRFLNTIGQEKYLGLLRKLAENAESLFKDRGLSRTLIASRVLLGYRDIKDDSKQPTPGLDDNFDDLEEPGVQREWSLNKASEIVIIDDVNIFSKFRDFVIAAPQEEILEGFYARFGVKRMSELVSKDFRVGAVARDQAPAQRLRKDILERARLFLHEYERDASSKSIRHDSKWLNSNMFVQCVSDISIRFSLTHMNVATSSKRSAVVQRVRGTGEVLYITPKYDLYDVSCELVKLLINRPKQNDTIALERILTESLRRLQAKGINVERILRKQEYEARIAKQQELEREYEEQQRAAEQAKSGGVVRTEEKEPEDDDFKNPNTPEKTQMPGSFGSPETELADNRHQPPSSERGLLNSWAKKFGLRNTPNATTTPGPSITDTTNKTTGPQITRDLQATKSNIRNAINECRPTDSHDAINARLHQDPPTQLDTGGYCTGQQFENLHKAFTLPYSGRNIDIYYGPHHSDTPQSLQPLLSSFLPLIFSLTSSVFAVNPAAINLFLDDASSTVAFNLGGSLFFNLAWFRAMHLPAWAQQGGGGSGRGGRASAADSWFFTYCHELAHNLVRDHDARHGWYQQQIAVEFSQPYRRWLGGFLKEEVPPGGVGVGEGGIGAAL